MATAPPLSTDVKAQWFAAFGDDWVYLHSRKFCDTLDECIAFTVFEYAYIDSRRSWDKILTALRLGCCSVNVRHFCYLETLMHFAVHQGRVDIMQVLHDELHASLDVVNSCGDSLLMYAVFQMRVEAMQWLLARPETALHVRNNVGETALDYAFRKSDSAIAECILAEMVARVRWSCSRAAWLAACVRN